MRIAVFLCVLCGVASAADNLASLGAGAIVVKQPVAYDSSWSGFWLIDEDPATGYAPPKGDIAPKEFVIELADTDEISDLSFDVKQAENEQRAAKTVQVDISDKADGGWAPLATATLASGKDDQHVKPAKPLSGRYLRVTIKDNHGAPDYSELMGFGAYGKVVKKQPVPDFSGAYDGGGEGMFRVKQTDAQAIGCYEHQNGLIANGGFEGRVLRFTWKQQVSATEWKGGPAVLVFPSDGKSFLGLWWNEGEKGRGGVWEGKLTSKTIGVCPHFKFATANPVKDALAAEGRARIYGITFDTDSDHIKDESKATLDQLVAAAKAEPAWKLEIQGHTDSTGTADHNQQLSEKRAASVKAYLVKAGIAADRLTTKGFGQTKPVESNDTALGRSQNRRVEVVKS
ncbi:MAG: OmpA family protein [Kofleriaceae bacterium]